MKFFHDIRYRMEYLVFRLLVVFVRMFPVDTAADISAWIWVHCAPHNRRHKRALENLKQAFPEKTDLERERIALQMWDNLGRVMAETMQLDRILNDETRITLKSTEFDRNRISENDSVIFVSLHTGNWELAISPLTAAGLNPGAVYRLVENPYIDRYIRRIRSGLYPAGLFAKGRARLIGINAGDKTARKLVNYIRRGGRLGVLCDLYERKGAAVPFFGRCAASTPFPALMARKMGSKIWMLRCIRIRNKTRFRIEIKPLDFSYGEDSSSDITDITTSIQAQFEKWIRQYPGQWMWSNRRWS